MRLLRLVVQQHAERQVLGFQSVGDVAERLAAMDEDEEDLLDRAWGLEPNSRLSCQAIVAEKNLVVEIPKYSINHAKEKH